MNTHLSTKILILIIKFSMMKLKGCNLPLSLVDNQVFIKMLNKSDNKYKLPGQKTLTDNNLYDKVMNRKLNIQKDFEKEAKFH
jgi:hypothetical protein